MKSHLHDISRSAYSACTKIVWCFSCVFFTENQLLIKYWCFWFLVVKIKMKRGMEGAIRIHYCSNVCKLARGRKLAVACIGMNWNWSRSLYKIVIHGSLYSGIHACSSRYWHGSDQLVQNKNILRSTLSYIYSQNIDTSTPSVPKRM